MEPPRGRGGPHDNKRRREGVRMRGERAVQNEPTDRRPVGRGARRAASLPAGQTPSGGEQRMRKTNPNPGKRRQAPARPAVATALFSRCAAAAQEPAIAAAPVCAVVLPPARSRTEMQNEANSAQIANSNDRRSSMCLSRFRWPTLILGIAICLPPRANSAACAAPPDVAALYARIADLENRLSEAERALDDLKHGTGVPSTQPITQLGPIAPHDLLRISV